MNTPYESVYVAGARGGLVLGPVMTLAVMLLGASVYSAMWSLPALACCLAVPVLAYFIIGKVYRTNPSYSFSALWLTGICAFFFGGLIMGAVVAGTLRWVQPGFMHYMVSQVVDIYSNVPDAQAQNVADTLNKMIEANTLPTPVDCALELIYAAVFSGSLLSMIYAVVVRRTSRVSRKNL
ncbi:MAG: DUF4199 domain-containing protein [Muribaculaceae bacterium]|nr:DUF4199 domain-containing protein [Muribaculaceae bacterium]